jgi:hypothetical protein
VQVLSGMGGDCEDKIGLQVDRLKICFRS